LAEYVFDQFAADGFFVHAVETLRPNDPELLAFRAMTGPSHDIALPAAVVVETSEIARAAGTPYVIAVMTATGRRVVASRGTLPPYTQLKAEILPLLVEAVRAIV